ncbi:MAG TPA: hypothetical protein PLI19_02495 [Erysipelotrichaceae bacterium]|nr:hypothetical protein [Erysipelotrichaceae bacterium]HQB32180.1 hypothetical protein [Erysipelotrichaceae bacterium]
MNRKMNYKDIFYHEIQNCQFQPASITQKTDDPALAEINRLFGLADALSIKNGKRHRKILLGLSIVSTLLTFTFLIYDEVEMYGLIFACAALLSGLFVLGYYSRKSDYHRKYLQYRILAEALRLQYYLSLAAVKTNVVEIMPWSIRKSVVWIEEVLKTVPVAVAPKKHSVLKCWIVAQKSYHEKALIRTEKKNHQDKTISKSVTFVTVMTYLLALIFELSVYQHSTFSVDVNLIRMILKIVLGTMSAITLFTGSYYGKMSLASKIDDHKRMIALYQKSEEEILRHGETDQLLLSLAREYLNENSSWYAYQKKNGPDLVL